MKDNKFLKNVLKKNVIWVAKTNKRHFCRGSIHVLPIFITVLSLGQWFFTCSVYSKRQCCHVFSSWASHLPERRSEADESSLLPHPCLHPHQPMAQPGQQNTRTQLLLVLFQRHQTQTKGQPHLDFEEQGMGEWERGLSCILPCGLIRDKHG